MDNVFDKVFAHMAENSPASLLDLWTVAGFFSLCNNNSAASAIQIFWFFSAPFELFIIILVPLISCDSYCLGSLNSPPSRVLHIDHVHLLFGDICWYSFFVHPDVDFECHCDCPSSSWSLSRDFAVSSRSRSLGQLHTVIVVSLSWDQ